MVGSTLQPSAGYTTARFFSGEGEPLRTCLSKGRWKKEAVYSESVEAIQWTEIPLGAAWPNCENGYFPEDEGQLSVFSVNSVVVSRPFNGGFKIRT